MSADQAQWFKQYSVIEARRHLIMLLEVQAITIPVSSSLSAAMH